VIKLLPNGLTVTEIAPGIDLERDVIQQASIPLRVSDDLRRMDARLFVPELMGLRLAEKH
jgi:acyl CoA:acetate/3-ketoacid CoA transferase